MAVSSQKEVSTKDIIKENLARLRDRETLVIDHMEDMMNSSNAAER